MDGEVEKVWEYDMELGQSFKFEDGFPQTQKLCETVPAYLHIGSDCLDRDHQEAEKMCQGVFKNVNPAIEF